MWLFIQSAKKARNLQRSEKMGSFENLFYSIVHFFSSRYHEDDPLSPPEGETA
jgi:hypothetical protein